MRRAGLRPAMALLLQVALLLALSACSVEVAGSPGAAPAGTADLPAVPTPAPSGSTGMLQPDPIPDECLLDASEIAALVGTAVGPPAESTVARPDGTSGRSCVASAGAEPVVMINVYRVRDGRPADIVRVAGGGRRALAGLGVAATVVETDAGPTLQVAGPTYLVTILVAQGRPGEAAWRAAAEAALSRLPR